MAESMGYRFLGKSGLKVSELCLGAMTFGLRTNGPQMCTEEQSHELLDKFAEMGGNFIDTANVYVEGKSEEILGNWLTKQQREKFIIATKVRSPFGDGPNDMGLSRNHIFHQVEESLKRLQTHYIDLYQIHGWDAGVPLEETLSALNDLVRMGKVRYIGGSNLLSWHMQRVVDICEHRGYDQWITLQQQYSLLSRESELDAFEVCKNEGIGVLPWSPLKGGMLSGKFRRDTDLSTLSDSRIAWASKTNSRIQAYPQFKTFDNEKTWTLIDKLDSIGKKYGKSVAQVSLRWLLEKNNVSSVIIGAKSIKQLMDNMGATGEWGLTKQEPYWYSDKWFQVQELDDASAYDVPYPWEMVARQNKDRLREAY